MLVLSRKLDEVILIGNTITITVCAIRGDKVRIGIEAPDEVVILRKELDQRQGENDQLRRLSGGPR
jgi:carbon storage regulator